jgi:hypothetical protein
MIRMVCYGILSVKELERVKREEVEYEAKRMINDRSLLVTSLDYSVLTGN